MNAVPAVGEIYARIHNPSKADHHFRQWLLTETGSRFLNSAQGKGVQLWTADGPLSGTAERIRAQFGYESIRVQCWSDGVAMVADPRGVLVAAWSLPGFVELVTVDEPRFRAVAA